MLKEEIIVTTHVRNAAGVCALSIGLLVCSSGGSIALADQTDAGGATAGTPGTSTGDDTTTSTIGSTSATSATTTSTTTATTTATGPISTFGSSLTGGRLFERAVTTAATVAGLTIGQAPTSKVQAQTNTSTPSRDDLDLAGIAGLDLGELGSIAVTSSLPETPPTQAVTPSTSQYQPPVGSDSATQSARTSAGQEAAVAPLGASDEATSATGQGALEPDPFTDAVVVPVSNAVALIARSLGQAGYTLANLPTSETPITDVIVSLAMVVGGFVGAVVEVAQVPGNLASLLGVNPPGVQPPLFGASGAIDRTVRIPVDVPQPGTGVSQNPLLPVATHGVPLGNVIQTSNIGRFAASGLKNELSLSGLAPATSAVNPATKSFLDNVVRSVLVPASLTALAAIAVPGLGGLLIVCAAGIRVGYRQAKAGLSLRASGIARFAGPGPMGVVRSGSLIALHTRTARLGKTRSTPAVGAQATTAPRLLESVA